MNKKWIILYNNNKRRLFATASRMVGQMDGEEIVHDAIIKYIKYGPKGLSSEQVEAWLHRTTIRMCVDELRRRKIRFEEIEDNNLLVVDEENTSFEKYSVEKIKKAINELAEGYRTILSLILFEGYDYQEISELLGIKQVSIRTQYSRAKIKLAKTLKDNG